MEYKNTFSTITKSFRLELEADSIAQELLMKENALIRIKLEMSELEDKLISIRAEIKALTE